MNERIREVAIEAGLSYVPSSNNGPLRIEHLTPELEKFAELIVLECMTICEELGDKGMDGHYCADKINKTFRS